MSPIQQMLLGVGAVATKTYVDDVFSTFLYKGNNGNTLNINNGIDLTGEGGMTWIKCRDTGSTNHSIYDTVRGASELLWANSNAAQMDQTGCGSNKALYQFNNNGFTLGGDCNGTENWDQKAFSSWTFRKATGFFDVVTYTGDGVDGRSISHSLGSIPGMWMVKRTDGTGSWIVGHSRMLGGTGDDYKWHMYLNTNDDKDVNGEFTYNSPPTATTLSLGSSSAVNGNGNTYVAYLFAGGESTAATARSVDFDGSDDQLNIADNTDFELGNGDFTLETWVKSTQTTSSYKTAIAKWVDSGSNRSWMIRYSSQDIGTGWSFFYSLDGWNYSGSNGGTLMGSDISDGQWHHIAVTRTGGKIRTFTDGILNTTVSETGTFYDGSGDVTIGGQSGNYFDGQLSNVRLVKGTALYTSSFRPPTEPLTNVTNTKLLCCNNSSVTGSTVTPGTITASSSPTANSDSPFDDPAGFVFGDAGDQNVIKCGSYTGNGSSTGPEINIGWEPQWLLIKRSSASEGWYLLDSMRGIVTGADDEYLTINSTAAEDNFDFGSLTPSGFKLETSNQLANADGSTYIYIAIRRPDGYVGKPPELGTGVFAMDTGAGSSTIPNFDSTFPVDFAIGKLTGSTGDWNTGARLIQGRYLNTNSNGAGAAGSNMVFDSNVGWNSFSSWDSGAQSWMWKRHAGFTVCAWEGDGVIGRQIAHDMNKIPEMIWLKKRTGTARNWPVYHKGLDGGSSPEEKVVWLNLTNAESDSLESWNNTAPTSTHFTIHGTANEPNTNTDGEDYIAMLFASVDGISKVGSYTGNGQNWHGIEVGFAPRFYMIKKVSGTGDWFIVDNTRGLDENLLINETDAQAGPQHIGTPSSTTWYIGASGSTSILNTNNEKYIYYVHA